MSDSTDSLADVTLAVFAGGEGSRMGRPKALLRINGAPILEFLLDRLGWPGPTMLVTGPGREHPPGAERFALEAVDAVAAQGPLRGLLTALESAPTPLVAVTAVDMPLIKASQLRQLVEMLRTRPEAVGLITSRTIKGHRQLEPFPGVFHIGATDLVRRRLTEPRRSVTALTTDPSVVAIDPGWESQIWLNLNFPADLRDLAASGWDIA